MTEKRKKILRAFILLLALVNLLVVDIKEVCSVQNKTVEEYSTAGAGLHTKKIKKGEIDTRINPVSKQIKSIDLKGEFLPKEKDALTYEIADEQGQILGEAKTIKVLDKYQAKEQKLSLDTSEISFEPGKEYELKIDFSLSKKAKLSVDDMGIVNTQVYVAEYHRTLYVLLLVINLLAVGFVFAVYKRGFQDRVFLAMMLAVGFLAVIMTVPFARDDEFRHYARAYDLATGEKYHFYGDVAEPVYGVVTKDESGNAAYVKIPKDVDALREIGYDNLMGEGGYWSEINVDVCVAKLQALLKQAPTDEMVLVSATGTYSRPLCAYWPQVLMILLGNVIGVRGVYLYYMAKAGQMIAVALTFWLAWKLAPRYKVLWSLMGFLPVAMLLYASCSSDGLMIAGVCLAAAMVLRAKEKRISLRTPQGAIYWILFFLLEYGIYKVKQPYALIALGMLLLLIDKKPSKKAWCVIAAVAVIGLMVGVLRTDLILAVIYKLVPKEHFEFWMANFVWVTKMMLHKGWDLLHQTRLALQGNSLISYGCFGVLAVVFCRRNWRWWEKLYSLFLFLCMLEVVVLFGYTLAPPDYGSILGVSFRYVLPSIPLFLFALPLGNEKTEKVVEAVYPVLLISIVFASAFTFGLF